MGETLGMRKGEVAVGGWGEEEREVGGEERWRWWGFRGGGKGYVGERLGGEGGRWRGVGD